MKKTVLLGIICCGVSSLYAGDFEPLLLPEFYVQKISPDGKWLYSDTGMGEVVLYDLETNDAYVYETLWLGSGNSISADGTAVGSDGSALFVKGDNVFYAGTLSNYGYSTINGITSDGSRIVGVIGNDSSTGMEDDNQYYFPYVADVDDNGNCSEPVFLPHPDKDFMGLVPQYSSATWISSDGKIILGQLIDYSGMFIQPIVYRQDAAGEWSYTLPTKSMFNPNHIEIPEFPGEFELKPVEPTDFMSDEMKEQYLEDFEWWETEGRFDQDLYPGDHLEDYMTPSEIEEYNKAVEEYNYYAEEYNEKLEAYLEARNMIFDTSVKFPQNGSRMNEKGTLATMPGIRSVGSEWDMRDVYDTYVLDFADDSMTKLASHNDMILPVQILNSGFIIGTEMETVVASYVYAPGATDYVSLEDYLAGENPQAAQWMQENLVHDIDTGGGISPQTTRATGTMISGQVLVNEDFTVVASGVPAYMFDPELYYFTYVFTGLYSGVKTVDANINSDVKFTRGGMMEINGNVKDLTIIDLSGRKVFEMCSANGVVDTNLCRGIYVITYTDSLGNRVSHKVSF